MKIALITDDFFPRSGGIAHVLNSLCKSFQNKKEKLFVINPHHKGKRIYNILDNKKYNLFDIIRSIKKKKFWHFALYSFWKILRNKETNIFHKVNIILYLLEKPRIFFTTINNIIRISPYIKKLNIDIILSGHSGNILPLVYILSKIFNKKAIAIAHGLEFIVRSYFSLKSFYFKNLDKIIVTNNRTKYFLRRIHNLDEKKINVINLGLIAQEYELKESKEELRKAFNVNPQTFVLLSVGRQDYRKNFKLTINAVSEIIKLRPNLKLRYYLIGEGQTTDELKKLTKKLNLENYVRFLGFCDYEIRNKYYKLSDLFLMPSKVHKYSFEGFGIVFLEANFYKVPCIGSYSGGIAEAIIDGETGLLIKSNDLNDLVKKIIFIYENENIRTEMGNKGYTRVKKDFLWDKIVNDYINVFKHALNT